MPSDIKLAGEGALFAQIDGPNSEPVYLGCHELGDVDQPFGDLTLLYCPGPNPNEFIVKSSYRGEPGPGTTTITTDITSLKDQLESASKRCPINLFAAMITCGKKNNLLNYDRVMLLEKSYITTRTISGFSIRNPGDQDRSSQAFDISFETLNDVFKMEGVRVTVTETENFLDISACDADECAGECGAGSDICDSMYAAGGVLSGSPANTADVFITSDAWENSAPADSDPFAGGEIIASIRCFEVDKDTTRIIVARGTTDAGNPAEIAYSDNGGASWTHVDVGAVTGQYAIGPRALCVLNYSNIWLVTSGGYIYKSEDGGATWSAQESGVLTSEDLRGVHFSDENVGFAVGDNNAILKTIDGGSTWSAVTGPTAQASDEVMSVFTLSRHRAWFVYNDGTLWYTHDGGTTISQRSGWSGSGVGEIRNIDFYSELVGAFVHNDGSDVGTILVTIDGGYQWKAVSVSPTVTVKFNSLHFCGPDLLYAVGEAQSGTGLLVKAFGG